MCRYSPVGNVSLNSFLKESPHTLAVKKSQSQNRVLGFRVVVCMATYLFYDGDASSSWANKVWACPP